MSITSLLAESYAGIPKSEYLKRLQPASQPVPEAAQAAASATVSGSNSAVTVDLSPDAQQMVEAQNAPFNYQATRTLLQEFSTASGIDFDLDKPISLQANNELHIGKSTEIARYLFTHIDEALALKPIMEMAYAQVDQARRARLPKAEAEQLHIMYRSFSSMTGTIDEALREKGYLPPDLYEKPIYAPDEVPDTATQKQDYHRYLSHRFESLKIPMTPELEALIQPEVREGRDMFGQTKFSLEDPGMDTASQIIGLTKSINQIYPRVEMLIQYSTHDPRNDISAMRHKADEEYASTMQELRDTVARATQRFSGEGRLEQAGAVLNSYLEEFGLALG